MAWESPSNILGDKKGQFTPASEGIAPPADRGEGSARVVVFNDQALDCHLGAAALIISTSGVATIGLKIVQVSLCRIAGCALYPYL